MTTTSLTPTEIELILVHGVGASEGATSPGVGLAGWMVNGQGQFDANGDAINLSSIIGSSGYTVGILQTDFGQRNSGQWRDMFNNFVTAFKASPQALNLSPEDLEAIAGALKLTGGELQESPNQALNQAQLGALDSFLSTSAGAAAALVLDQSVVAVTVPTGTNAADAVAESGGDASAQSLAAAVAMKLFNQTGQSSSESNAFNDWLQNLAAEGSPITTASIQGWVKDQNWYGVVSTGVQNTIDATTTLNTLGASSNPTLQAIYQDYLDTPIVEPQVGGSSDGLYDLGQRLLSVSPQVASTVMNAISSGSYYQGTSSSSINGDGTLAAGSHGTIIGANGDIVIWNADGSAFAIVNGASVQLSGISAIQVAVGEQSVAVSLPNGDAITLDTDPAPVQCFPAGVSIALADGATKPIEAIVAGDLVLAFDPENPRGALKPARVTHVFRNVTEEWLVLDKGLSVTPGHRFLNERGEFERIDSILARGGRIVGADGAAQAVAAERVVYSQDTRRLYEEAEELVATNDGALALRPDVKRGWRTYNFEVEGLHTYVAGGIRVHNDSLYDTIVAEDDFAQITGTTFDPTNPADVQLLAQDIASGTIPGGALVSSIGPDGDLTALEQRLVSDHNTITNVTANANGYSTFTDSYGDQIVLDSNRQEVSESVPDGQGGSETQVFGYSSNGVQYVASEQDVAANGQVVANIVNTVDPTSGALLSSTETDYDGSGNVTDTYTQGANGNLTSYEEFNADGSTTDFAYNSAGEVSSNVQYAPDGGVIQTQNFSYDSNGNPTEVDTLDGAGDLLSTDVYQPDGSDVLTNFNSDGSQTVDSFNAAGVETSEAQVAPDGSLLQTQNFSYDSSGNLSEVATTGASGNLLSTDVYQPDGSDVLTNYNGDGSQTVDSFNSAGVETSQAQVAPDGTLTQTQNFSYDSNGNLSEVATLNGAGGLVNTDVYNSDGTSTSTDYNAQGQASEAVDYAADGSVSSTTNFAYDSSGGLASATTYDGSGNLLDVVYYDASDGSQTEVGFSGGAPANVAVTQSSGSSLSYDAGQIAASLSSTIGDLLSQNGSIFDKIAADTISGDIGTVLQQLMTMSGSFSASLVQVGAGDVSMFDNAVGETFGDFGADLPASFANGVDLGLSSVLTAEAAQALGISGFAGVAFSTIAGTITQQLVHNAEAIVLEDAGVSLQGYTAVDSLVQDISFASLPTQIGGAFGSYFGSLLVPPTGLDGEIGAAIGSSIGASIGTAILPIIGTFIGSFLGDILGTLFGDLFSRPPQATDQIEIDPSSGLAFRTGGTSVSGASASMFYPLADAVVSEVNQVLSLAGATFTQSYVSINYKFKHNVMTDNSVQFASSGDPQSQLQSEYTNEADKDSLEFLQNGAMQSSDVIALAGLGFALAQDTDVASVAADEQTAKDYETYLDNSEAVNALIAADPNSVFAAGWAITLMRAEELGLTQDVYDAPGAVATLQTSQYGDAAANPAISNLLVSPEAVYVGPNQGAGEIIDIYSDSTQSQLEEEIVLGPNGQRQDYDYYMNQTLTASGVDVTTLPGETLTILGNDDVATAVAQTTIHLEGANDTADVVGNDVTVSASGTADQVNVADDLSGVTISGSPAQIVLGAGDSVTISGSPGQITMGAGDNVDASGVSAGAATSVNVSGRDAVLTISGATINVEDGASVVVHGTGDVINVAFGGFVTTDATGSSVTLAQGGEASVLGDGTQVSGAVGGQTMAFVAPQGAGETTYSLGEVAGGAGLFETSDTDVTTSDGGVLSQQTTQVVALGALSAPDSGVNVVAGPQWGGGTIEGAGGEEEIDASGWSNVINAGGGSGVINAGQGQASVNAGSGNVIVNLDGYNNGVNGGDGADFVSGSQGNSTVSLGNGEDTVITGGYYNSITLGGGEDVVQAGQGNETIALGGGNDSVDVAGYYNMITAGDGADIVNAGQGNETISLGNGNDALTVSGYSNKITLGGGNDAIAAGDGNEIVTAGSGADTVTAGGFSNLITLGDGADTVNGGEGSAVIKLGSGADTINVSGYNNAITVGDGADVINAGDGSENVVAGNGDDTITAAGYNNVIKVGNGDNVINAGAGSESVVAGSGSNAIAAQGYNDQVSLGAGSIDNSVTMSNGALSLGAGAAATLTGDDNSIALSSNNTVAAVGANETYALGANSGASEIASSAGTNTGNVSLAAGISDENLWLLQSGNNLQIDVLGTSSQLTIDNWFGGPNAASVQSISADNLRIDKQVGLLVQAMASFGANNPAFNPAAATQMPNDQSLQNAIAAAWHG